ncbi:MAG: carbohydrate ABC transporter substrate-binding protein [Oscillospiraceae bacterium]|nr:carbohydrate ABC transporter substrate-binding protein [Oscillospiraceae bacterium]
MMLFLCACSGREAPAGSGEGLYYYRVEMKSSFPLGMDAVITGLGASGDCVFVCGNSGGSPLLSRVPYKIEDGELNLGAAEKMELPACPAGSRAVSLCWSAGKVYLLLEVPDGQGGTKHSLNAYLPGGSLAESMELPYAGDEPPAHVFVQDTGEICLRSMHNIWLYTEKGELIASIEEYRRQLFLPMLIGGEIYVQSVAPGARSPGLSRLDPEAGRLSDMELEEPLRLSLSACQNDGDRALINNGGSLIAVDEKLSTETVLNWVELTADSGQKYDYICRLAEDVFLMVPASGSEMVCLTRDYRPDTRKPVRIGLFGDAGGMVKQLQAWFGRDNPDYRVECISYGRDEAGLTRLLADIGCSDKLDIVISEGWQLDPGAGFADLYPFIDKDEELSRESFVPWMLEGLERRGALRQVWGSFTIGSWLAFGPLAEEPEPLALKACRDYLEKIGYDGLFMDEFITKDSLIGILAAPVLWGAFDEEKDSYVLDEPWVRELAALCSERPLDFQEPDANMPDSASLQSQVLRYASIQLPQLQYLNEQEGKGGRYRLFDGSDGGRSLTTAGCGSRSCYMIPETCKDKEKAWGFLRTLLTAAWQERNYAERATGYPSNVDALETVLKSYASEQTRESLYHLLEGAVFCDYDTKRMSDILVSSMQPYLYGDSDLETALKNAQGRINIYYAEHKA